MFFRVEQLSVAALFTVNYFQQSLHLFIVKQAAHSAHIAVGQVHNEAQVICRFVLPHKAQAVFAELYAAVQSLAQAALCISALQQSVIHTQTGISVPILFRQLSAQKSFKAFIAHIVQIQLVPRLKELVGIGVFYSFALLFYLSTQPNILAGCTNENTINAAFDKPAVFADVPIGKASVIKLNFRKLFFGAENIAFNSDLSFI